jgi:hypothetical protein
MDYEGRGGSIWLHLLGLMKGCFWKLEISVLLIIFIELGEISDGYATDALCFSSHIRRLPSAARIFPFRSIIPKRLMIWCWYLVG